MKERLLVNGKIYTACGENWEKEPAEAMLIDEKGIITYVGAFQPALADGAEVVDLEGKAVLPGFVDAHVHIPGNSLTKLFEVNLFGAKTKEELQNRVRKFLDRQPGVGVIFGAGFDMGLLDEDGKAPCAEWIDDICGSRLAVFQSGDMHSRLLNTKAMKELGLLESGYQYKGQGRVHVDHQGKPTGLMTDTWDIDFPEHEFSKEEICQAIQDFQQEMLAWGYTSIMAAAPFTKGLPVKILAYLDECDFQMRVNGSVLIKPEIAEERMEELIKARDSIKGKRLRITTAKYMIDGVLEGNTAYLKEDYHNIAGFQGESIWEYDALVQSFRTAIRNGFQIHAHTIGDAAVEMTLNAVSQARAAENNRTLRHVLTHLQLVDEQDLEKFGANDLIAAVQTFWHYKEPGFYENVEVPALGEQRAERMYPLKSLKQHGAVITNSGDYPVSPDNDPMLGIQMGVTRTAWDAPETLRKTPDRDPFMLGEKERLTVKDLVKAYTINGAYQLFREKEIGSLEKGKYADYLVLDSDPMTADPMCIGKIKVHQVYISGRLMYKLK